MSERKPRRRRSMAKPLGRGIFTDQKPGRIAGIHWAWWVFFIVPAVAWGTATVISSVGYAARGARG